MALCLLIAGKATALAISAFTLSWTHSVERVRWEEDWTVSPVGLQVVEARVKGSASGMEPPEGAELKDGWWVYRPELKPQASLLLAQSGATGEGWSLCSALGCMTIDAGGGAPAELRACKDQG